MLQTDKVFKRAYVFLLFLTHRVPIFYLINIENQQFFAFKFVFCLI